jgi:hypothetical protein
MIENDGTIGGPLRSLVRLRNAQSHRTSSHDRSGGNEDFFWISPGERRTLLEVEGPGCITHIWMTLLGKDPHSFRNLILRMWWDGEAEPSVEAPLGDFFGVGHSEVRNFASLPLCMAPQSGRSLVCYFPMPFATSARVELKANASASRCDSITTSITSGIARSPRISAASTRSGGGRTRPMASRRWG